MNVFRFRTVLFGLLALAAGLAQAVDLEAGREQYEEHCTSCHGTDVYTRANRMVKNRQGLSAQVQRCQIALNLNWFEDEVENTAEFLNREFYHFNP